MKFRRTVDTVTLAVTAAFVAVTTATPAAAASWDHVWYSTDDNPGATVKIRERGDVVQICDSDADGHWAYTKVEDHDSIFTMTSSGNGDCRTVDYRSNNLPEGKTIKVVVGIAKGNGENMYRFDSTHYYANDH